MDAGDIIKLVGTIAGFLVSAFIGVRAGAKSAEKRYLLKGSEFEAERELRQKLEQDLKDALAAMAALKSGFDTLLDAAKKEFESKLSATESRYNGKAEALQRDFTDLMGEMQSYQLSTTNHFVARDDHKERLREVNERISDLKQDLRTVMASKGNGG